MESNDTYKKRLIARLDKCHAVITALDVLAENAAADDKPGYVQVLDVLHTKKREAAKKITELQNTSGAAWEEIRLSADEIWDDLGNGIAHAVYSFK